MIAESCGTYSVEVKWKPALESLGVCSTHADVAAIDTCIRCGDFICDACTSSETSEKVCVGCIGGRDDGSRTHQTRLAGMLMLVMVLLKLVGSGGILLAGGLGLPYFLELLPWSRTLVGVGLALMGVVTVLLARGGQPGSGLARGLLALLLLLCMLAVLRLHPDFPPMGGLTMAIEAVLPLMLGLAIWRRLSRGLLLASIAGAASLSMYFAVMTVMTRYLVPSWWESSSAWVGVGALLFELAALSWLALWLIRPPKAP